ncbi:hypothetical protein ACFV3R_25530 [Streptomyces sp. NPDC059740]|uniref:hypothetical protein n=1 Tax=Streptomyces sp. NPDC059740 TaxID=3346926 RepID=UPI003649E1A1
MPNRSNSSRHLSDADAKTTRRAITYLTNAGQPELAQGVSAALSVASAATWFSGPTKAVPVPASFIEHMERVRAETGDQRDVSEVVRLRLVDFALGTWTPTTAKPFPRPKRGTGDRKNVNVRLNEDLRAQIDARGSDPAFAEEHGFTITTMDVARAALLDAYPLPDDAD